MDIGGANTKAALLKFKDIELVESCSYIEYFPFWEKTLNDIPNMFLRIVKNLVTKNDLRLEEVNYIAVTITAELSDAFQTKREGIITILNALENIFDPKKMYFISNKTKFLDFYTAKKKFSLIAAANWVSTSLFLGKFVPDCILIDAGSTTIDVIPIKDSIPIARGHDDITRLVYHELIYTGGLRATIPSITHFVPYKGKKVRISFEKFALISDIHRILGNVSETEYINETADNRSKTLDDCYARLARVICMDIEMISKEELNVIAKHVYEKQIKLISTEIQQFMKELIIRKPEFESNKKFVITDLASEFLTRKSLLKLGYNDIFDFKEITKIPDNISSSALAVAGSFYFQL